MNKVRNPHCMQYRDGCECGKCPTNDATISAKEAGQKLQRMLSCRIDYADDEILLATKSYLDAITADGGFSPERVKTLSHPDLHGHLTDAIQDAFRLRVGRIVHTDFCRAIASDVITHFEELKADV